jgi:myosin-5
MTSRSFKTSVGCKLIQYSYSIVSILTKLSRLSPNQIQKLLNQYLVADYEQPINGEIMKAVASRVTEKSDVLLLTAVDMDDSGPYEIAEPRVITALETYTPSCEYMRTYRPSGLLISCRAPNTPPQASGRNCFRSGNSSTGKA